MNTHSKLILLYRSCVFTVHLYNSLSRIVISTHKVPTVKM